MVKDIIDACDKKMSKTISVLNRELASLKAGRANPTMLDRIEVEYYGNMTPINQVANVSAPEPRIIMIQPWDKSSIKDIEKAIQKSDLGINPSSDGITIRLIVPELTEETRKELVKKIRKIAEDSKIAIRSERKESNDKLKSMKKNNEMTDDELKKAEDDIQKKTDCFINEIDKMVEKKEKDIMSI